LLSSRREPTRVTHYFNLLKGLRLFGLTDS
jgi:hypothetical protein